MVGVTVAVGCTTIDPGPTFVVPNQTFNEDYFYCVVEPQLIFGKGCGDQNGSNANCHYNSSAVSGMPLQNHPPVDCAGEKPTGAVTLGSPAKSNYTSVSLNMSRDYLTAAIYVRPTSNLAHPVAPYVYPTDDPVVDVIRTWAQKP
ncbi:hypothetical protein BH09MYX1_BH09MYX1_52010 [soil metagenome]